MSTLDAVLTHIDQDIDQSVERLFALLRIASISTDPAYKDQCRAAAEHVATDLRSNGFSADVRPTAGHPVVVGKSTNRRSLEIIIGRCVRQKLIPRAFTVDELFDDATRALT